MFIYYAIIYAIALLRHDAYAPPVNHGHVAADATLLQRRLWLMPLRRRMPPRALRAYALMSFADSAARR